ncbi:Mitochondrial division protein 1 [Fulvia fulva]|uniref:Mitochondrial division protein 1 n=1 Tax=Passalora fulva TaxID=5499 RepID=A0A9Q8PDT8_PASFU|nr:Mitochondrial division protein 1 [Fulvia fulva]KAK4617660.1 Mitochondrial division protein 1 [Fulvia fulva]KAK4618567.1 Mitochondrial division protein 1 [Fulvia fulva]UJO20614.1 Mitochondrial division protein 1 [Fulvia fulva]WPV18367.1 Mitochondrial division protein 1 [Fulvia fulva]WPV33168.1 Mitochondrial division protein 1 [Fulvia fulva]
MADSRGRSTSPAQQTRSNHRHNHSEDDSIVSSRHIEQFGRTIHATASQLIGANFANHDAPGQAEYRSALSSVRRFSQRPAIQRSVFSFARANPTELIRSHFQPSEIEHRALTYIPDEVLRNVPESSSPFSLFEGFKASLPEDEDAGKSARRKRHSRHGSKGQKAIEAAAEEQSGPPKLHKIRRERDKLEHRLEMVGIRKTMCSSEIREIDNKIANLNTMRKVILDRLAGLEDEEREIEQEVMDVGEKLEEAQEAWADEQALAQRIDPLIAAAKAEQEGQDGEAKEPKDPDSPGFMSESVYGKLPKVKESPKPKRKKQTRRISMPVLHEHMEPGSRIREIPAHNDVITAIDFDAPFGILVTAALDDTVRVWDLNAGRCMGLLEGHLSSVRCLQVDENIVATGSMDASIRLWDLNQADYNPQAPTTGTSLNNQTIPEEDAEADSMAESATGAVMFTPNSSEPEQLPLQATYQSDAMAECHMLTLQAHVAEVTALNFNGNTLVSGSADKTLRQWDLENGRCMQTLDVMWAAAQASTLNPPAKQEVSEAGGWWRPTGGRVQSAEADFIGALQVFQTALACGTADGMVRLWDLRSGMVHRSLVGHTGPVTSLQFDDVYLVTGSQDRSIRIWDLRTGNIHDAFAYDNPITSMQFDARRIVAAAGEDVVKVYDKTDGRQWDCGAGATTAEDETKPSIIERVRIKDGYMVEGRRDGVVGVWSC